MSQYLQSLGHISRQRYLQRLKVLGLADDPYLETKLERFTDQMTAWPQIEFDHIFGYFIKRPGVFTQEELLDWKSLQAYNFFQSGFVCILFPLGLLMHRLPAVILAKINLSMKSPDKPHALWIAVEPHGVIITAHCTSLLIAHCSFLAATALAWQLLSTSYSIPHHSEGT